MEETPPPASPTVLGMQTGLHVPGLDDVRCLQAGGADMIEDVRWPMEEALVTDPEAQIQGPNDGPDGPPQRSAAEELNEP